MFTSTILTTALNGACVQERRSKLPLNKPQRPEKPHELDYLPSVKAHRHI